MKRETTKALAAFNEYCLLGPRRSLTKLSEMYGKSTAYVRQLERWSSAYDWVTRSREYDASLAEKIREQYEERRKKEFNTIRELLLRHIRAEVEPTAASQIQAARALFEHYIVADSLDDLRQQLQDLRQILDMLEATP